MPVKQLAGKTILLTSGPTTAPLDDVRYIANRSTGRLGSEIGLHCVQAGAYIIQLAGPGSVTLQDAAAEPIHDQLEIERYETVEQLKGLLQAQLKQQPIDAVLMAAAVLDYIPVQTVAGKQSSQSDEWVVTFRRGEKLIEKILQWSPGSLLVGFKLESRIDLEALQERALDLMQRSGAQLVVANRLQEIGEEHVAYLVSRDHSGQAALSAPLATRREIAQRLVMAIAERLNERDKAT